MNNRNMALSLMDNINTCSVVFAHSASINMTRLDTSMKTYTYAYDMSKLKLEAGSRVVVNAQGSLKVCLVTEVHEYNQIDTSVGFDYALVLDVVDTVSISETEAKVAEAYKVINESVRRGAKQKVLDTFTGNMTAKERAKLSNAGITLEHQDG